MSKFVSWGHGVVGLIFASVAAECIWELVGALIIRGARFGPGWPDAAFLIAVVGAVFGLCSWGILKWRPWGHALAIVVSAIQAFFGIWAALVGDADFLFSITALLVLIWLLLPPVRAAYRRRAQSPRP